MDEVAAQFNTATLPQILNHDMHLDEDATAFSKETDPS